jgi:Amt family ammonium transporter
VSLILKKMGMLRIPEGAELAGMDLVKVPGHGYSEGIAAPGVNRAPGE